MSRLTEDQVQWLKDDKLHASHVDTLIETGTERGIVEIPQANALRALLELRDLRAENERLRQALEFYGNRDNWTRNGKTTILVPWDLDHDGVAEMRHEFGALARAALYEDAGVVAELLALWGVAAQAGG
jgi:hypothetical protein